MKILFVHQNFPGQYLHLSRYVDAVVGHEFIFLMQRHRTGELFESALDT
jgi:hypothetical protein